MSIVQGVPNGYTDPITAGGGIAIGATPARELKVSDAADADLLRLAIMTLLDIHRELILLNNNLFPTVNFDNERTAQRDYPPNSFISNPLID